MRTQTFTIPNRLASYGEMAMTAGNDYKALKRRERHNVHLVRWAIDKADIAPIRRVCTVRINWVEPTSSRRHADVAAGAVFIEQALISSGVVNDAIQIEKIVSTFHMNADNPRVEVTIEDRF